MRNLSLSNSPLWSALSVFIGAIPLAYLALYPKLAAVLWRNHALGLAAFVVLGLGFVALGIGNARGVWAWLKRAPRPLVWLMALIFALPMLHAANVLQVRFNALTLIPLYAVVLGGVLGLVAWREWGERGVLPLDAGRDSRGALRLALIFALLSLAANLWVMTGFGLSSGVDAPLYMLQGEYLFDTTYTEYGLGWQGLPYRFMNNLMQSSQSPDGMLVLHAVLTAFAVGAVVYALARHNQTLAWVVGVFLSLDPTWLAANRGIQTEGPTVAFLLMCLALVVAHMTYPQRINKSQLLFAGVFYAATISIRVYNLVLLVFIVALYALMLRPRIKLVYLVVGIALVLIATLAFNQWRYKTFAFTTINSFNYDAALFVVGLFEPSNGDVSQQYQDRLVVCFPEIKAYDDDFVAYLADQEGEYPYYVVRYSDAAADCMLTTADTMSDLMREAVSAKPMPYITSLFEQNSAAFALAFDPILIVPNALIGFDNHLSMSGIICDWCDKFNRMPRSLHVIDPFFQAVVPAFTLIRQPYLLLPVEPNVPQYMGNLPVQSPSPVGAGNYEQWYYPDSAYCTRGESCVSLAPIVAWFLWAGFVFITARGSMRLLVLLAFLFIHVQTGLVTVGFMFEARYALAYTPLMMLISVIGWVTIGAGLWQSLRHIKP